MAKICTKDNGGEEVFPGDKFKVASCCARDGIPLWHEGMIGKVENIGLDFMVECEFLAMPLQSKTISVKAFKKHCQKHKPTNN